MLDEVVERKAVVVTTAFLRYNEQIGNFKIMLDILSK